MIGCGGPGKTTLAGRLGEEFGHPVIHSDFYRPGWEEAQAELIERVLRPLRTTSRAP